MFILVHMSGRSLHLWAVVSVVMLAFGVTPPVSAAGRPDLIITSVSNPPVTAALGSVFVAKDVTKNRGAARAGASYTRFYLSIDRTFSRSDRGLKPLRKIGGLGPGGRSSGVTVLKVPLTVATRSYFLLACADAKKEVSESKEGNNCRASSTRVRVPDETAPPAPEITGTDPAGPSSDETPKVLGNAEAKSTVSVFDAADCLGTQIGSADASSTGSFSVPVTLADNATTTLSARAVDAAGNVSECSNQFDYVEDSAAPSVPVITSPSASTSSADSAPEIIGTADAGSTVRIYEGPGGCAETVVASGTAAEFASPGLTVTVSENAVYSFRADAVDEAGNVSDCSQAITYEKRDSFELVIGLATGIFPRDGSIERRQEVALGNLMADAHRLTYGTQLAFLTGGQLRAPLPSGYLPSDTTLRRPAAGYAAGPPYDLVAGDCYAIFPFGNRVVTRTVTGQTLWAMLENGVASAPTSAGKFPQISGFKFTYDPTLAVGARVVSVSFPNNTPIPEDSTTYTISLSDFTNAGGDGYSMLNDGFGAEQPATLAGTCSAYLKSQSSVSPLTDGRISTV